MDTWLEVGSLAVAFGGLGLAVLTLLVLFFLVRRAAGPVKRYLPGVNLW